MSEPSQLDDLDLPGALNKVQEQERELAQERELTECLRKSLDQATRESSQMRADFAEFERKLISIEKDIERATSGAAHHAERASLFRSRLEHQETVIASLRDDKSELVQRAKELRAKIRELEAELSAASASDDEVEPNE